MTEHVSHSLDRIWEIFGKTKDEWEAMAPGDQMGHRLAIIGWQDNPDGTKRAVLSSDVYPGLGEPKGDSEAQ